MALTFVRQAEPPKDVITRDFVGVGACVIFVEAPPGERRKLHRHPSVELLIVIEGTATFDDGTSEWLA